MDNKTIVRKYIEDILNAGDVTNIRQYVSEEYAEVHDGVRYKIGIEGAQEHIMGLRRVYPDLKLNIEHQISEGEWVATIYSVTGTFMEEWLGMHPTGKKITYTGVNVDRIVDGIIVEHGGAANLLGPLLEAGAVKKTEEYSS